MSTESVSELQAKFPPPARMVEKLRFITTESESVSAFDLVYSLGGVCRIMDQHPVVSADDWETHETMTRLATAARILADQLESRIEFGYGPKRRRRESAGGSR